MENENATLKGQENLEGQETDQAGEATYTQAELDAKIESEADRRVTKALKTAKAEWLKEQQTIIEKEKDEAAKLAKMTEADRQKAQLEKDRQEFQEEREKFMRNKLELEVVKQLAEEGLSPTFATFLMGADAEESTDNIKAFKKAFDEAVEEGVKQVIKGRTPKANEANKLSKEDILKMTNRSERLKAIQNNPGLFF